jgi:hypothetical protein
MSEFLYRARFRRDHRWNQTDRPRVEKTEREWRDELTAQTGPDGAGPDRHDSPLD